MGGSGQDKTIRGRASAEAGAKPRTRESRARRAGDPGHEARPRATSHSSRRAVPISASFARPFGCSIGTFKLARCTGSGPGGTRPVRRPPSRGARGFPRLRAPPTGTRGCTGRRRRGTPRSRSSATEEDSEGLRRPALRLGVRVSARISRRMRIAAREIGVARKSAGWSVAHGGIVRPPTPAVTPIIPRR